MLSVSRLACATMVAGFSALALACSAAQEHRIAILPVPGWYVQDDSQASFQPCGAKERLLVVEGADLRRRAGDFGLQDGDPIYVRLVGSRADGEFRLVRVAQFGSPVPIRNCPMTGTTLQQ